MEYLEKTEEVKPIKKFGEELLCTPFAAVEIAQRISDPFKHQVAKTFLKGGIIDHRYASHLAYNEFGQTIWHYLSLKGEVCKSINHIMM